MEVDAITMDKLGYTDQWMFVCEVVSDEELDEENDEPMLKEMPRLIFHFNRRSLGRLRQLVDTLNQTSEFN